MLSLKSALNFREFMWDYPSYIKRKSPASYIILSLIIIIVLFFILFKNGFYSLKLSASQSYIEGVVANTTYYNPYSKNNNQTFIKDVNRLMFSRLIYEKSNGSIENIVAKSIKEEDNYTKYVISLHKHFYFSNGVNITAKDIVYSFNFEKEYFPSSMLSNISIYRISKYKVEFLLKRLDVTFYQDINFFIVPFGSNYILNTQNIISSGEYKMDYLTNNKIVLTENKYYFYGKPHFKYFVIQIFNNYKEIIKNLKRDQIDGAYIGGKYHNIYSYHNLNVYTYPLVTNYVALFFNLNKVTSITLRNALSYSLSPRYISTNIMRGTVSPMYTSIPSTSWAFDPKTTTFNFNQKKAADLLSGNQYNLKIYYINTIPQSLVNYIKQNWSNIGVNAIFVPENTINIDSIIKSKNYDGILTSVNTSIDPNMFSLWYSKSNQNISQLNNSEIDRLLLVGVSTLNINDRKETYSLIAQSIQNINPAIFLYSNNFVYVANKTIKNLNFNFVSYPYDRFLYSYKWYN